MGVPSERIQSLFNEEANRTNIIQNLQALTTNDMIARGSPIIIYYAGHGSKTKAPSNWLAEGTEIEMLLPCHFNPNPTSDVTEHGLLDIDIGTLLSDLAHSKGNNIVCILLSTAYPPC